MIQAMTSGHAGSMTTLHADSAPDALNRLETMAMMSGVEIPLAALRLQIAGAIHVIVQMMRFVDGGRRVVGISQVVGLNEFGRYEVQDLFNLHLPDGEHELVKAKLQWTGKKCVFRNEVAVRAEARNFPSLEPLLADK
jgi:pilus assembly protein CpaF